MGGWADSNGVRVAAYVVAAAFACLAGRRELHQREEARYLWPTFWFLTAGVLLAMALGRASDLAELVADIGRREARSAGWYTNRRLYQAMAVVSLSGIWFVVVVTALWRVPERRRRYLPMAILTFSLVCFALIRMISLHQVDALLYRRQIAGTKVGAVVELLGLAIAVVMTLVPPRVEAVSAVSSLDRGAAWAPRRTD